MALEDVLIAVVRRHDEDAGLRVDLEHPLHDGNAIALRHAQIQYHYVRSMLLIERDGLIAIARFGHDFHIRLLVHHCGQSIPYYGMVISQNDPNLSLDDRDHHGLRFAMRTLTRVPAPGRLSMCHSPPMAFARWRMLMSPNPSLA
jgi:hypothetical protein